MATGRIEHHQREQILSQVGDHHHDRGHRPKCIQPRQVQPHGGKYILLAEVIRHPPDQIPNQPATQ